MGEANGFQHGKKRGYKEVMCDSYNYIYIIWLFPKIGVPRNGWFIMEHPIKMDDLEVPLFLETPILTIINPYYHIVDFGHTVRHPGHLHKPRHRGAKASTHIEGLQGYISNLYIE